MFEVRQLRHITTHFFSKETRKEKCGKFHNGGGGSGPGVFEIHFKSL